MNPILAVCAVLLTVVAISGSTSLAQGDNPVNDSEAAYTQEISRRVERIVATLGITDSSRNARVQAIIGRQYRDLREIHDARDAKIKSAKGLTDSANKASANAEIKSARDAADSRLKQLHSEYLSRLSGELSSVQVDQAKDGMTYGVLPLTYGVYLKMYPQLSEEQMQKIKDWLVEAREFALDAGSSQEKHALFGKYKGRINNYLSAAGYDAKAAEANLRKRSPAPTNTKAK